MLSGSAVEMEFQYQMGNDIKAVHIERAGGVVRITIADHVYEVSVIHSRAGELVLKVGEATRTIFIASEGSTRYVAVDGDVFELKKPDARRARRGRDTISTIPCPLTAPASPRLSPSSYPATRYGSGRRTAGR